MSTLRLNRYAQVMHLPIACIALVCLCQPPNPRSVGFAAVAAPKVDEPRTLPAPASLVSTENLMETIRSLPTKRAGWSDDEHFQGLIRTQQLLIGHLRDLGLEPELHEVNFLGGRRPRSGGDARPSLTTPGPGTTAPTPTPPANGIEENAPAPLYNLIVDLPGREFPREVLVISAHFDAVPMSPGADDDGTGVAAVLELARILRDRPLKRTVRLILFNLEELGLVGSRQYVASIEPRLKAGEEKIIGMVSLDMLGYYSDEPESQKNPLDRTPMLTDALPLAGIEIPTVADFIGLGGIRKHQGFSRRLVREMQSAAPDLKVFALDFLPIAPPDLLRSDHAPFLAVGVPAVILSDSANFRNPHYHLATDTIDTIDQRRFTLVVQGLAGAAEAIANSGIPVRGEGPVDPREPDHR